jgi:hypothetical protein
MKISNYLNCEMWSFSASSGYVSLLHAIFSFKTGLQSTVKKDEWSAISYSVGGFQLD